MKRNIPAIFWIVTLFCVVSCGNETKKEEAENKPTIKLEEPVIPSARFASFVNGFTTELPPSVYDTQWLNSFLDNNQVREISPKVCEEFIYNKTILNHGLGKTKTKQLSADKPYYYIGQIADSGQYTMLIFSDLEESATETYLCTYTKDGKYVSGIVLQADFKNLTDPKQPIDFERVCRMPAGVSPILVIEERFNEEDKTSKRYIITNDGHFQKHEQSS